jgi:hypothetical protein
MAFTTLKQTQNQFLESYLRGTNQTLTAAQAEATFGIKNLSARVHELRSMGLTVTRVPTKTTRRSAYKMSRRDVFGYQSRVHA